MLLEGRPLRTYHATRLLPHEVESIRHEGLHASTRALLEGRIDEAVRRGQLDRAQAHVMRSSTTFARGRSIGRVGIVCSMLGRARLRHRAAVQGLLCCWGGEALHGHDREMQRTVSQLGTPTVVVLNHPMPVGITTNLFPGLVAAFRDAYWDPGRVSADVIHHGPLPPTAVAEVLDAERAAKSGRFPELEWLKGGPLF